jgi:hypothetical protein
MAHLVPLIRGCYRHDALKRDKSCAFQLFETTIFRFSDIVDDAIEEALLGVVGPGAVAATTAAARQVTEQRDQVREALGRDLEAARYAADRAFRHYDAADPANRLVAGELEARWNRALICVAEAESKIAAHEAAAPAPVIEPAMLGLLAPNLKTVWSAPATDVRLKKRIVRTLLHEVVADIDDAASEIVLVIHWNGGAHSEVRLPKCRRGQRNSTSADIIAVLSQLVLIANDELIAGLLNRNGLKTGNGNRWTRDRVTSLRSHYRIPVFRPVGDGIEPWLNLSDAARFLKVAPKSEIPRGIASGPTKPVHFNDIARWVFQCAIVVAAEASARLRHAIIGPQIDLLIFDAAPEALRKHIVPPSPLPIILGVRTSR